MRATRAAGIALLLHLLLHAEASLRGGLRRRRAGHGAPLRLAFAVTITTNATGEYLDGVAALAHSVALTRSRHSVSLLAILPPGYTAVHAALAAAGYELVERRVPVRRDEIRGKYLRETIEQAGCCGSLELLKVRAHSRRPAVAVVRARAHAAAPVRSCMPTS